MPYNETSPVEILRLNEEYYLLCFESFVFLCLYTYYLKFDTCLTVIHLHVPAVSDVSNSSWADIQPYVIGSYSLEPLSLGMKQRLILQYLTPMGEYQEVYKTFIA